MEYASVTVQLTIGDIVAFNAFVAKGRRGKWRTPVLLILAIAAFLTSYFLEARRGPSRELAFHLGFFGVVLTGFVILLFVRIFARRRLRSESHWRKTNPAVFLPNLYQVLAEGLYLENDRGQHLTRWIAIERVVESAQHIYVMETRVRGHAIPKRCFSTPEAAANFADQARLQIAKHAAAPSAVA